MNKTLRSCSTLVVCVATSIPLFQPAVAADFEPAVRVGITYTDNVFLEPVDLQNELIYRLEPSFVFTHESPRVSVNADYLLQSFWYDDIGENEIFHQYNASVEAAIVPENLFITVGGDRTQSVRDPRLGIPQSNIPISANRADRDEYFVSPRLQMQFGEEVALNAQYRHAWVDYSGRGLRGSENQDANFSLDNYRRGSGLSWALKYDWRRSEYDDRTPWENQRATAELGFWAGSKLRIFGSGGLESAWDMPLDGSLEDTTWEAGFAYNAGDRITAEFAAGERSFGSSWRGRLNVGFRRGNMEFSYAETPKTEGRDRYREATTPDGDLPPNDLSFPGRTDRYIANRLNWRLNFEFRRVTVFFNAYDESRTDRTTADGIELTDESLLGAGAGLTYEVGPRTDLRMTGRWSERELAVDDVREIVTATIAADYKLGAKTTLTLQYIYDDEQGDGVAVAGRDYRANTVSLLVAWTF